MSKKDTIHTYTTGILYISFFLSIQKQEQEGNPMIKLLNAFFALFCSSHSKFLFLNTDMSKKGLIV